MNGHVFFHSCSARAASPGYYHLTTQEADTSARVVKARLPPRATLRKSNLTTSPQNFANKQRQTFDIYHCLPSNITPNFTIQQKDISYNQPGIKSGLVDASHLVFRQGPSQVSFIPRTKIINSRYPKHRSQIIGCLPTSVFHHFQGQQVSGLGGSWIKIT